jgi:anti-sigma factor RsiW
MDCRDFRDAHLAYLDDTLPGDAMAEAQRHLLTCDRCAAHDSMVRRSLVLARNHLPEITPSADFRSRLDARLAACRAEQTPPLVDDLMPGEGVAARRRFNPTWLAVAAGLGVVTTALWQTARDRGDEPLLPPALASAPAVHVVPTRPVRIERIDDDFTGAPALWSVDGDAAPVTLPRPRGLPVLMHAVSSDLRLSTSTR